jgi:hypothetical protein
LAAWQLRDHISPDRWSRRAVALLVDCDAHLVEALQHLTENLLTHWPRGFDGMVRVALGGPVAASFELVQIIPQQISAVSTPVYEHTWRPHRLYPELFALLRTYQFAAEEGHEGKMLMRRGEAVYLVRLFLGSVAASKFPGAEGKAP